MSDTGMFADQTIRPDTKVNDNIVLFDMYHGYCWYFMQFLSHFKPEMKKLMIKEKNKQSIIHAYCCRYDNKTDRMIYADARGMTDNSKKFFEEYNLNMRKNLEIIVEPKNIELSCFGKEYYNTYHIIYKDVNVLTKYNNMMQTY